MIKRPKPKVLSAEAQKAINAASAAQTGETVRIRSYDKDYPVFDTPVDKKILVYVPNHTVMSPEGAVMLRMDKFAAHPCIDGRQYLDIRCTAGVVADELGLDGSCPLCDSMDKVWDLYNRDYASIAKAKGIDPKSPEAEEGLKEDRKKLVKSMVIKKADVWYTFPIVVIECQEKDGVLTIIPKKDADGRISGKPMWYSVRERTYIEKWLPAFDSLEGEGMEEVPTTPAGLWAVLNFCYKPKSGNPDKMGSARNMNVTFKPMQGYEQWATYFDQITEGWTPEKAQETVVLDVIRDMEEQRQVCDTLMKPVEDKLAMYELGMSATTSITPVAGSAEAALAEFGGAEVDGESPLETGSVPIMGEMPNVGVETE